MPELPEVETVLQGVQPLVEDQWVRKVVIRENRLRWTIPAEISQEFRNQKIKQVRRRGKYLLFETPNGTAILHFGMSGSLTIRQKAEKPAKHDHFDIIFDTFYLRYNDPRRFGTLLWIRNNPLDHPLLAHLGLEPFDPMFNRDYLFAKAKNKKTAVKTFIMNSAIVVGVGNIYAAESLFLAEIHPLKPTKDLSLPDCERLTESIKKVLLSAIKKGGTTLKNFISSDGKPGYFKQKLNVYGRAGLPCQKCQSILVNTRLQNRATVYCPHCQHL